MRSSERHNFRLWSWLLAAMVSFTAMAIVHAVDEPKAVLKEIPLPPPDRPAPGSIRVENGMIFSGMYSKATTLAPIRRGGGPLDRPDQQLEMRLIDQKAREIYVSGRRAEPPVANNLVWPNSVFVIPQKRISRKVMPEGIPTLGPFDSNGVSRGTLHRPNGRKDEIVVGIVAVVAPRRATVVGSGGRRRLGRGGGAVGRGRALIGPRRLSLVNRRALIGPRVGVQLRAKVSLHLHRRR